MRGVGTVLKWLDGRGCGFVLPDGGREGVFVHVSNVDDGRDLRVGERVEFDLGRDRSDRVQAVGVRRLLA